jgi:hypothetical protein
VSWEAIVMLFGVVLLYLVGWVSGYRAERSASGFDVDRFARSYYKCGGRECLSHDYHLRSASQIIEDYRAGTR